LEIKELTKEVREEVPMEEDPRESPHKPLRLPALETKVFDGRRSPMCEEREREREAFGKRAIVLGFKYKPAPSRTCLDSPNIVRAYQTLFG
jgi:hypothetical protein